MTDERIAIGILSRCRFAPGTWDKEFAASLAETPEDYRLTPKQRANLWRLVVRYRRQYATHFIIEVARRWLAVGSEERAFREAIEADTGDSAPRLVFADWLDERGREGEARLNRFIGNNGGGPFLRGAGSGYGNGIAYPMNFEWTFGMAYWELFKDVGRGTGGLAYGLNYWNRSIEEAEADLMSLLARSPRTEVPV